MPIDLSKLKSARVIEDPQEAHALVSKAHAESGACPVGRKGQTLVRLSDDGRLQFRKAADFSLAGEGAPVPPTPEELKALAEKRAFPWNEQYPKRMKTWWASDERVDAHGDIVKQAWSFDEFAKNSPMPMNHGWGGFAVGRHLDWRVLERRAADYSGPALWLCGVFATAETDPEADRAFRHVDAGLMPAGSVGFYSNKVIDVKDEEERKALGLGRWGYVLDDNHLLEFSPTMIGANPGALTIWQNAKSRGLLLPEDVPHIRERFRRAIERGQGDVEAWTETDKQVRTLARLLFPKIELRAHDNLDEPITETEAAAKAKRYTPPATKAAAGPSIEEKVQAVLDGQATLVNAFNDAMGSIQQQLDDLRTMLEDSQAGDTGEPKNRPGEKAAESGAQSAEEVNDVPPKSDRRLGRLVMTGLAKNRK